MAHIIPELEETEMNMTPMIDIVFQLIIFFLLSLKFKSVDDRIDSHLPKDRGERITRSFVPEIPALVVKLFREDLDTPDEAFTKVRIANRTTIRLPPVEDTEARRRAVEEVQEGIRQLWAAREYNPEIKGEIRTPGPKGIGVPHGDVLAVLDAFLGADVQDIVFEGERRPMPEGYPSRSHSR